MCTWLTELASGRSLRREVEECRTRCVELLKDLTNDMQDVSSMSLQLSAENGPVCWPLRATQESGTWKSNNSSSSKR